MSTVKAVQPQADRRLELAQLLADLAADGLVPKEVAEQLAKDRRFARGAMERDRVVRTGLFAMPPHPADNRYRPGHELHLAAERPGRRRAAGGRCRTTCAHLRGRRNSRSKRERARSEALKSARFNSVSADKTATRSTSGKKLPVARSWVPTRRFTSPLRRDARIRSRSLRRPALSRSSRPIFAIGERRWSSLSTFSVPLPE